MDLITGWDYCKNVQRALAQNNIIQEEADLKNVFVKNGYTDLKHHQNAKIRKIFKWADRSKH